ncbi:MAG: hypothetical protein ACK5JT_18400 [Hyphomicrobiaceae bacterium]
MSTDVPRVLPAIREQRYVSAPKPEIVKPEPMDTDARDGQLASSGVEKPAVEPPASEPAPAPVVEKDAATPEPQKAPDAKAGAAVKTQPATEQTLDAAAIARLLMDGRALFEAGRVAEARRRFLVAMSSPHADVLLALARTYDTYYLSRLPAVDAAPDMQRALVLYQRAVAQGSVEANADLERTSRVLHYPR